MVGIDVRVEIRDTVRYLDRTQRRQVPYATALALNDTAFDARGAVVPHSFEAAFDMKNARWPGVAIRVAKATKTRPIASVYDRLGRGSLNLHADGGIKRPKGSRLAVPADRGRYRNQRTAKRAIASAKTIRVRLRSGVEALVQRQGRGGRRLKLIAILAPQARIGRRFGFYEDAQAATVRVFGRNFDRALARALSTAV